MVSTGWSVVQGCGKIYYFLVLEKALWYIKFTSDKCHITEYIRHKRSSTEFNFLKILSLVTHIMQLHIVLILLLTWCCGLNHTNGFVPFCQVKISLEWRGTLEEALHWVRNHWVSGLWYRFSLARLTSLLEFSTPQRSQDWQEMIQG